MCKNGRREQQSFSARIFAALGLKLPSAHLFAVLFYVLYAVHFKQRARSIKNALAKFTSVTLNCSSASKTPLSTSTTTYTALLLHGNALRVPFLLVKFILKLGLGWHFNHYCFFVINILFKDIFGFAHNIETLLFGWEPLARTYG